MLPFGDESRVLLCAFGSTPAFVPNNRIAMVNGSTGAFIMMKSLNVDGNEWTISLATNRFLGTGSYMFYFFANYTTLTVVSSGQFTSSNVWLGYIVNDTNAVISLNTGQILMVNDARSIIW